MMVDVEKGNTEMAVLTRGRPPGEVVLRGFSKKRWPGCLPLLVLLLSSLAASPAEAAGITGFIQGAWPGSRAGMGFAVGIPLFTEIVTLEGEYSRARAEIASPSLTIWSGSILLVLPVEVVRLRPYLATGFGFYRQIDTCLC